MSYESCCKWYKEGLTQINDCIIFCSNQSAAPKYDFKAIEYCPWCGTKIHKTKTDT